MRKCGKDVKPAKNASIPRCLYAACGPRWSPFEQKLSWLRQMGEAAEKKDHAPIDLKTPHSLIRELMKAELCWRCKRPLKWTLGMGKTPHLHHSHTSGEIFGFTHPHCNPLALEHEIDELRQRIAELEQEMSLARAA